MIMRRIDDGSDDDFLDDDPRPQNGESRSERSTHIVNGSAMTSGSAANSKRTPLTMPNRLMTSQRFDAKNS